MEAMEEFAVVVADCHANIVIAEAYCSYVSLLSSSLWG